MRDNDPVFNVVNLRWAAQNVFFCWFAGDFPITADYIKDKGYVCTPLIIWRFPKSWRHPSSRMVYKFTMDNTKIIWVRIGGAPHFMKPPYKP